MNKRAAATKLLTTDNSEITEKETGFKNRTGQNIKLLLEMNRILMVYAMMIRYKTWQECIGLLLQKGNLPLKYLIMNFLMIHCILIFLMQEKVMKHVSHN